MLDHDASTTILEIRNGDLGVEMLKNNPLRPVLVSSHALYNYAFMLAFLRSAFHSAILS